MGVSCSEGYTRAEVFEKLLQTKPGTSEYIKWKEIWDQMTSADSCKFAPEWTDPVAGDWMAIESSTADDLYELPSKGLWTLCRYCGTRSPTSHEGKCVNCNGPKA